MAMSERIAHPGYDTFRYTIESKVGAFPVVEVKPSQLKSQVPVTIATGWSEGPPVFTQVQAVLAIRGRQSFVFDHPRWGGNVTPNTLHPEAELRKAYALLALLDERRITKTDVLAHSEGAIYAIMAATLAPEKFRNFVLVAPGGMIGKDAFPQLLGRFSHKVGANIRQGLTDNVTFPVVLQAHLGAAAYIAKNPLRALREAVAISQSQIQGMLKALHEQGFGIVIIHGANDKAFPMQRIQKIAHADQFDGILSVTGMHDDLYVYPHKDTAAAEEMLSALEIKRP